MKKILIPVSIIAVLLCTAAKDADQTVISPDRLFLADNGKSLFVTNRAGSELIKMSADGKEMEQKVEFSSPVNAMTQDPDGNLWVVCDGNYGMMYQLDGKKLSIQSKTKSGATPSDILYNPLSQSLWVAQRFNNELWEIDPATRKVKAKITVGREPVAIDVYKRQAGANVHDVALMRRVVGSEIGVKAAGGIRDLETALALIQVGATRIGTSSGIQIVEAYKELKKGM